MQILEQLAFGMDDNVTIENIVAECNSIQGYLECMVDIEQMDIVVESIDLKATVKKILIFIKSIFEKMKNLFNKFVSFIRNIGKKSANSNKTVADTIDSMSKNGAFSSETVSNNVKDNVSKLYGMSTDNIPKIEQMTKRDVTEMIINSIKYSGPSYDCIAQAAAHISTIVTVISNEMEWIDIIQSHASKGGLSTIGEMGLKTDVSDVCRDIKRKIIQYNPILAVYLDDFGDISTPEDIQRFLEYIINRTLFVQKGYITINQVCDGVKYVDLKLLHDNVDSLTKRMDSIKDGINKFNIAIKSCNKPNVQFDDALIQEYSAINNISNIHLMVSTKILSSVSKCMVIINTHASRFEEFIKELNDKISIYMK